VHGPAAVGGERRAQGFGTLLVERLEVDAEPALQRADLAGRQLDAEASDEVRISSR
jgi:hypothetical protein